MTNNIYFSYLDKFPQIPESVLPSPREVIDAPYWSNGEKFESMRHPWARAHYHRKRVTPKLKEWLLENINLESKWTAAIVVFNTTMLPHRDIRDETYNFILTTGGEIRTEWYNRQEDGNTLRIWDSIRPDTKEELFVSPKEIKTLESVIIEPKRWHRLKTDAIHGTVGDMTGPRIILSIVEMDKVKTNDHPLLVEAVNNWFNEW